MCPCEVARTFKNFKKKKLVEWIAWMPNQATFTKGATKGAAAPCAFCNQWWGGYDFGSSFCALSGTNGMSCHLDGSVIDDENF